MLVVIKSLFSANFISSFLEKIFKVLLVFLILVVMAKHFDKNFVGEFSLILAVMNIATAVSLLGINNVVVSEVLINKVEKEKIYINSFFLLYISAIVVFLLLTLINAVVYDFNINLFIFSFTVFFNPIFVCRYIYEADNNVAKFSMVEIINVLMFGVIKLTTLYYGLFFAFYITFAIEAASAFLLHYLRFPVVFSMRLLSLVEMKRLFKRTAPVLISTVTWILYSRIDQLMISGMMGVEYLAEYVFSVRIIDVIFLITVLITNVLFPYCISNNIHHNEIFKLINLFVLVTGALVYLFSELLVFYFLGHDYSNVTLYSNLLLIGILFSSHGLVVGKILVHNGNELLVMVKHVVGLCFNVLLNYFLISLYGVIGAVISTLVTLFFVNFIVDIYHPTTRSILIDRMRSFLWKI